jgi:hypothetical protein
MKEKIVILISSLVIISGLYCGCIENQDKLQIISFTIDPQVVNEGETVTLRWIVNGAKNVSINNGIGLVNLTGSKDIIVNETTVFILTAKNDKRTLTYSVKVTVKSPSSNNTVIIDNDLFENASRDPIDFLNISIFQDIIYINVRYSGGCVKHDFYLIFKENFLESDPVQIPCVLYHDDNDDPCDSIVLDNLNFDLTPLKEKWQEEYQGDSGRIIIRLENYSKEILYVFEEDYLPIINVTLKTDKTQYNRSENISINITVTNNHNKNVTITCSDARIADFEVFNEQGERVYLWSYKKAFAQMITKITIQPGETYELLSQKWNQFDDNGSVVPAGKYTIRGWIPGGCYIDEGIQYDYFPNVNMNSNEVEFSISI